jgi:putative intracellular protease/amidase
MDPRSVERAREADPDSPQARFLDDQAALADLARTVKTAELTPSEFDGVFLVGGRGAMWDMPEDNNIARLVSEMLAAGRLVGSICHGPAGLLAASTEAGTPAVAGRRLTCFSDEEERVTGGAEVVPFLLETRLRELGAEVEVAGVRAEHAIRDGNLVTGQNPASSQATTKTFLAALHETN